MKKFKGQGIVEYALIATLVVVVSVPLLTLQSKQTGVTITKSAPAASTHVLILADGTKVASADHVIGSGTYDPNGDEEVTNEEIEVISELDTDVVVPEVAVVVPEVDVVVPDNCKGYIPTNEQLLEIGVPSYQLDEVAKVNLSERLEDGNHKYIIANRDGRWEQFMVYEYKSTKSNGDLYYERLDYTGATYLAYLNVEQETLAEINQDACVLPILEEHEGYNVYSPLILDMNGDGLVSAVSGQGVDINGDGIADGAAADGDKMLAMGDLNNDGVISGSEVFGDQTINPFTGEALNARNGFEALKLISEIVFEKTGINCTDNAGFVDVVILNKALTDAGITSIGLISDENVTELEGLGKVSKIDTNYTEVTNHEEDTENIFHKQISQFIDIDGIASAIHDVWFSVVDAVSEAISSIFN